MKKIMESEVYKPGFLKKCSAFLYAPIINAETDV